MKQKLFAALLALTLVLALTACQKTEDVTITTTEPVVTVEKSTEKAEETTAKSDKTVDATVILNDIKLTGTWSDRISQRATMEVRGGKDQVYQIHVHWGSTAFESENWNMTATFNDATGELTYKDCTRMTLTLKEDGAENEAVRYTDGKGKFLYKNGELYWQAANDEDVNECVFVR